MNEQTTFSVSQEGAPVPGVEEEALREDPRLQHQVQGVRVQQAAAGRKGRVSQWSHEKVLGNKKIYCWWC